MIRLPFGKSNLQLRCHVDRLLVCPLTLRAGLLPKTGLQRTCPLIRIKRQAKCSPVDWLGWLPRKYLKPDQGLALTVSRICACISLSSTANQRGQRTSPPHYSQEIPLVICQGGLVGTRGGSSKGSGKNPCLARAYLPTSNTIPLRICGYLV